ncbi:MAG TPA: T9SS type A sorting domain-containing protein [Aequorivita sp.]|nr:T9SS type A sorting domain-containing protein [Aequorivita sp.]
MRKTLLILSFFTVIPTIAQDYKTLLDNYNEWQLTTCFNGCLTDMYYTAGDTLVDGKEYKILDGYHYISRTFLLREDVSSKSVYINFVSRSGNTEYLLYDFSLNVGDSIDIKNPVSPFPFDAGYFQVDSIINRILVDENAYKHFYLSPTPSNTVSNTNAVWIEGVGSLSLINAPSGKPDINGAGELSCFFKNGELFYSNLDSISACEPLVLGTDFGQYPMEEVTLNSLITDGICQMYNTENIRLVDIFDLNGRKLDEKAFANQSQINLNFSNYSAGMYLVVAYSSKLEKKVFKVFVK